jgi:metal transporter CNNM
MELITLILITMCLLQSGIFSGLTLGLFGLSRLRLEIEVEANNKSAIKIMELRKDSNFLLATLLWGNVGVNVLLTLLTESVMTGASAFIFSTVVITCFGEIAPQAYFSRNALRLGAFLAPLVKVYQIILYPVVKPSALILDWWLGREDIEYFKEESMRIMLERHMRSSKSDIDRLEGIGALNFLAIDDVCIFEEGSIIDQKSIISLPVKNNRPIFPEIKRDPSDPFLQRIQASGKKWVTITDMSNWPIMVLDSDAFLRDAAYGKEAFFPYRYCHRPIIITSPETKLEKAMHLLKVFPQSADDDVIDQDLILYWGAEKRIITGSDIFGRLMRGIVIRVQ